MGIVNQAVDDLGQPRQIRLQSDETVVLKFSECFAREYVIDVTTHTAASITEAVCTVELEPSAEFSSEQRRL
jgi:hypothetical protein